MTTDGDSALRTPHSAGEEADTPNASVRAAARAKVSPKSARTQRDWLKELRVAFTPPEIWSERRPSLREVWLYAKYGPWTSEYGFVRWMGRAYAWSVALPLHTAGYYLLWIVQRPTRLVTAVLLGVLIGNTGPGRAIGSGITWLWSALGSLWPF